jgi:UDP-N-acetylmuramoyl-tripeptide--D-alanyl-D-alanine ligase
MPNTETYTVILFLITEILFLIFCYYRALIYLRYFQQEEYSARRFLNWMLKNFAFDKRGGAIFAVSLGVLYLSGSLLFSWAFASLCLLILTYFQKDPRIVGKIKLNMTARASRIFYLAVLLFVILFLKMCLCGLSGTFFINHVLLIQFIPFTLIASNLLLTPFEKYTKNKFKNEAKKILKRINPYVIGITGSYGKTSVKSALGEILNTTLAPTFCPPKSINTEMGITREIRENMKPGQKYAVIEMGAYNVGSIERLCRLTPPHAGIVTVVGMAHLERYKSINRVYLAKSELAKAVPSDGLLVCNGDDPGARRMAVEFPKKTTLLYGTKPDAGHLDCVASNISFSLEGSSFNLHWKGKDYQGFTKLLGYPALLNLLGVFTLACALGADPDFVLGALRNLKPVDNRLSLSKEGDVFFLRDAYNSNPLGFEAALDVLSNLSAARKILMTPGMVELGTEQFKENKKAALKASKICNLVIIVGTTNKQALREGLEEGGFNKENIFMPDTRADAFKMLNNVLLKGDLILIENDLPDLYEMDEKF